MNLNATAEDVALKARIDTHEKYLDRMLAKTEASKADLDKNWMGQITSIALSLALIAGLGTSVAKKLLDDSARYDVLYIVLPLVNTYFFVRFGHIGATFSKARYNAEKLTLELQKLYEKPIRCDVSQIYKTNSYFEWAHQTSSAETVLFLLTIPLIFSLNHSLTIYLIYKVVENDVILAGIITGYVAICSICYYTYYKGNKDNTPVFVGSENLFILASIAIAAVSTVFLLMALGRFDPQPGRIDPRARTGAPPHADFGRRTDP